ncbi:hypothetical protein RCG24_20580 [Neobacillus sp. OS1-32]|uniref:hypothetical protein n=1 Tax=Neobacillus sp. OS1-32 TaxID=3070682 RepID=UPI0027DF02F4|nr:hypothetical protein [Neobacillus sp. OS1-32]WML30246.1 hypothetical protein RCG24_20580 [Neobacillus sp. OS1-32]
MDKGTRVELLIAYLQALCNASRSGVKVYEEIRRVIAGIEQLLSEGESENGEDFYK